MGNNSLAGVGWSIACIIHLPRARSSLDRVTGLERGGLPWGGLPWGGVPPVGRELEFLRARQSVSEAAGPNLTVVSTTLGVMIPAMWTVRRDNPGPAKTLRLRFYAGDECLSYADFLRALVEETTFRELIQEELRAAPFAAFRWKTPPLTAADNLTRCQYPGTG
jgi:hypothetical protein